MRSALVVLGTFLACSSGPVARTASHPAVREQETVAPAPEPLAAAAEPVAPTAEPPAEATASAGEVADEPAPLAAARQAPPASPCAARMRVTPISPDGAPELTSLTEPFGESELVNGRTTVVFAGWVGERLVLLRRVHTRLTAHLYDPRRDAWSRVEGGIRQDTETVRTFVAGRHLIIGWDGRGDASTRFEPILWGIAALDTNAAGFRDVPLEGGPRSLRGRMAFAANRLLVWNCDALTAPAPSHYRDGVAFDFESWTWLHLSATRAPSTRNHEVMVALADRVFVWGGLSTRSGTSSSPILADGAVFDAGRNEWTPITPAAAPSARYDALAHGFGDRVAVFGGLGSYMDTRGVRPRGTFVYDLGDRTWRSVPQGYPDDLEIAASIAWGGRVVGAGPRVAIVRSARPTPVFDLLAVAWASAPARTFSIERAVTLGRRAVAFVARPDDGTPRSSIVVLDLEARRWCAPPVPLPAELSASWKAAFWGGERELGVWGAIVPNAGPSCPRGAPCPMSVPSSSLRPVGLRATW